MGANQIRLRISSHPAPELARFYASMLRREEPAVNVRGGGGGGNPTLPSGLGAGSPSNSFALKFSINQTNLSVFGGFVCFWDYFIVSLSPVANEPMKQVAARHNSVAANQHVKDFIGGGGGSTKARGI